jgi:hypothetical protein
MTLRADFVQIPHRVVEDDQRVGQGVQLR